MRGRGNRDYLADYIRPFGLFYKNKKIFTSRVSDCKELVGYLMEHLGINESNYFIYQLAGPNTDG